jgi:hypothetical protein
MVSSLDGVITAFLLPIMVCIAVATTLEVVHIGSLPREAVMVRHFQPACRCAETCGRRPLTASIARGSRRTDLLSQSADDN